MICWGLNQGWTQWAFGGTFHDQYLPPPAPDKCMPALDLPAPMGYPPGMKVTHKVGAKTYFDGNKAVQQGHDIGYFILHLAAPANWLMLINTIFSKHKVEFPVTSVLIEGKPMGTYVFMFGGLVCGNPISLPTGICVPFAGTIQHEMGLGDFVLGLAFIVVDVLIDAIWSLFMKGDRWEKWGDVHIFKNPDFKTPIKKVLDKIWTKAMQGPKPKLIFFNGLQKLADHFGKSWAMGPLLAGTIFQIAQPATTLPRTALPQVAVGRAGLNVKFLPWPPKFRDNIFN